MYWSGQIELNIVLTQGFAFSHSLSMDKSVHSSVACIWISRQRLHPVLLLRIYLYIFVKILIKAAFKMVSFSNLVCFKNSKHTFKSLHFKKMFWHLPFNETPSTKSILSYSRWCASQCCLRYLSRRLDQCCRAQTGAADWHSLLYSLQQDPGSRDVTPRYTKARLHLPAATSRYMVCYLQAQTPSCLVFCFFFPFGIILPFIPSVV